MPTVRVNLIRACNLVAGDKNGKSDPYVILQSSEDKKKKFKSKIKKKTLDPIWNETFYFDLKNPATATINVEVYDHDFMTTDDILGTSEFSFEGLTQGIEKEIELKLARVPHGTLSLSLDALDFTTEPGKQRPRIIGKLRVTVVSCRNLIPADRSGSSDPFVTLKIQNKTRLSITTKKKKTLDPEWNETFDFDINDPKTDLLKFAVYDYDKYSTNDFLGEASVSVLSIVNCGSEVEWTDWLPLLDKWKHVRMPGDKERGDIKVKCVWYGPDLSLDRKRSLSAITQKEVDKSAESIPPLPQKNWEINFDDIVLGKELGRGAFGVVYKGTWRQQECAVKQLAYKDLTNKELDDFKQEAELMMSLRPHKNIVTLLGVATDPSHPLCIVTEFVDGGSLESLLRSQAQLNWPMILHICKGVCAGMYHLHEECILHRDLAARNILLEPMTAKGNAAARWTAQITDFGLSKQMKSYGESYVSLPATTSDKGTEAAPAINKTLTQSGTIVEPTATFRGPYKYMAPESLRSITLPTIEFSVKTDVWSYGVVLWEIMSRQEPFPGVDLFVAAHKIAHEGLRLPLPPRCPTKFTDIMQACWQDNPEDRPNFQGISDMLGEIAAEIHTY